MLVLGLGLASIGASACASQSQFVWYSQLPRSEWGSASGEYVIGVGDVISIRVYEQEGLSGNAKIRRDGRIALPLAGEIVVAGKQPQALAREIEARLAKFVVSPRVTVNVEQAQPIVVSTLGEIGKVGTLTLEPPARILDAIAQAGGPSEYADDTKIFVLRQFPTFQRIRFTYKAILDNEGGAATFPLRTGDVILIE